MVKLRDIAYLMLYVSDLDVAIDFYRGVLGMELMWKETQQGHAALSTSAGPLVLRLKPEGKHVGMADGPVIAFEVADVQACADDLRSLGVALPSEPEEHAGRITLRFSDPFGNPIELNQTKAPANQGRAT